MTAVVDTGPLFALADRRDRDHHRVQLFWEQNRESLVVPISVLPETCHLIERELGPEAEAKFLESITYELHIETLTLQDIRRSSELIRTYADNELGFVDASLVAVAERLNIVKLVTLDQRHFLQIRPRHCPAFELLPA